MRFAFLLFVVFLACLGRGLWLRNDDGEQKSGEGSVSHPDLAPGGRTLELNQGSELDAVLTHSPPKRESLEEALYEDADPVGEEDFEEIISSWDARQRYWKLDPLQKGPCTLSLTFYDVVSGEAVSGDASIWRLGVPANEWWTAGDRGQSRFEVKGGLATVKDLPPGRYRAYAHFARRGADSAPEFLVGGDLTSVDIPVEMPRPQFARLHLLDIHGSPVQESPGVSFEIQDGGFMRAHESHYRPNWVRRRRPTDSSIDMSDEGGGVSPGSGSEVWEPLMQPGNGIDLGELPGDPRAFGTHYRRNIRVAGGRPVSVWLAARQVGDYVAILPDMADVLDCIELPDGVTPSDVKGRLRLTARAVSVDISKGESISSQWKNCQISFALRLSGYQTVYGNWRPGLEPKPQIRLEAK